MELIYDIFSLNAKMRRDFEQRIAPAGLTYPKWLVLKAIKQNEGIKACELKEIINMDKATLSELLNRLEKEGCIVKKSDKNDRRISRLFLSPNIISKCGSMMCLEQQFFNDITEKVSVDELTKLTEIIQKLNS